ncbi:MAG: ATP-binding cassette domain-containing protein [Oscillospiraceae bacterium]|nr:ATP-binding cassette domain-containing protein [Oscillospiraceae bacterium]
MSIISVNGLVKRFGKNTVLNGVNVEFEAHRIHGLIGRNGSGKTVLMKCICGLTPITGGTVTVSGKRIGKDCEIIPNAGVIIETPGFLPNLSGYSNLKNLAALNGRIGKDEVRAAISKVGLNPDEKKHVGKYSLGMRQRLGLAQAIMEDPEILILDEPMNGLDKDGVKDMRQYLLDLKAQGKTILIASHSAEDIDVLCDTVCEMDKGILTPIR